MNRYLAYFMWLMVSLTGAAAISVVLLVIGRNTNKQSRGDVEDFSPQVVMRIRADEVANTTVPILKATAGSVGGDIYLLTVTADEQTLSINVPNNGLYRFRRSEGRFILEPIGDGMMTPLESGECVTRMQLEDGSQMPVRGRDVFLKSFIVFRDEAKKIHMSEVRIPMEFQY